MDEYARSAGWANNDERMEAIRADNERKRRRERELNGGFTTAAEVKDQWARDHGYLDCADYQEREGLDYVDACCNIARSFLNAATDKSRKAFGTTPREYNPTPEQLRAGRIALGLEQPEEKHESSTSP